MKKNIITLSLIFIVGCGINPSPGTGEKVGQIVKIANRGLIWKTFEAELIRGGMSGGSGSFGTTPFDFTIEDADMAKKAEGYMNSQTEVKIKYRMEGVWACARSESDGHFLISIEPLKP